MKHKETARVERLHYVPGRLDSNGFRDVADLRKEIEWKDAVIAFDQRMQAEAEAERDALLKKYNLISEDAL